MKALYFIFSILLLSAAGGFSQMPDKFKPAQNKGIAFTENKGQVYDQNFKARPDVLYGVMAGNMAVHIKRKGISYQLTRVDSYKDAPDERMGRKTKEIDRLTIYRVDLNWLNCNKNIIKTEEQELPGYSNYYLESCPAGALQVKSYAGIRLSNLYEGIDLHYYETGNELKHDYIVAPHADYRQIQIEVLGAEVHLQKDGSLFLLTPLGNIHEGAPVVYQNKKQLKAKWKLSNNILSFEVENYNPSYELIIDPVTRLWGTYYGSPSEELFRSCAADPFGNIYMSGYTTALSTTMIATLGSHQSSYGGGIVDACLVKFNSSGTRLWATYYGGSGYDDTNCASDAAGNVFMAGITSSSNTAVISTSGSHQVFFGGGSYDAFLVKFNSSGVRQWGTYYGGSASENFIACSFDNNGNIYAGGSTGSGGGTAIATLGSHQPVIHGLNSNAFLVKFSSSGARLWGTYYGGSDTYGRDCTSDNAGNVYLVGNTTALTTSFVASPGCHQPTYGGSDDAFIAKFNSSGVRQWGTYYGGTGSEAFYSCDLDANGMVYVGGSTSTNAASVMTTPLTHQPVHAGLWDALLVKFNASGARQWATYYGGSGTEDATSCVTDSGGNVYLAGYTSSSGGTSIATPGSHQTVNNGGSYDAFLVKFDGSAVRQNGTYYGGTGTDYYTSCAVDPWGMVYLSGTTATSSINNLSTSGVHQVNYGGGPWDGFLAKFDLCESAPSTPGFSPTGVCPVLTSTFTSTLTAGVNSYTWSLPSGWTGSSSIHSITALPGSTGIFTLTSGNACGSSPQQTVLVTVHPLPIISVNNGSVCFGQSYSIVANGAVTYTYSSGPIVTPAVTNTYNVAGTNIHGCIDSVSVQVIVHALPNVSVNSGSICSGQSYTFSASGATTYSYSGGNVVSPGNTSSYTISGTNTLGCTNTVVGTVTVNPNPTITANSGTICLGDTFTITPGGAGTYTVQGGSFLVNPVTSGSYSIIGNSTAGCISTNTAIVNVMVNSLPSVSASNSLTLICAGENVTLTAGGASTYTFNPGGEGAMLVVTPSVTTIYTVTGTGPNGCKASVLLSQIVDECVGISKNTFSEICFKLYPNPNTGILTLELPLESEINIINALGQIVYRSRLNSGKHQIDLRNFTDGVYFAKAEYPGVSKQIKFIKSAP